MFLRLISRFNSNDLSLVFLSFFSQAQKTESVANEGE